MDMSDLKPEVFFVDYIDLIVPEKVIKDRKRLDQIWLELKRLSEEKNIIIIPNIRKEKLL